MSSSRRALAVACVAIAAFGCAKSGPGGSAGGEPATPQPEIVARVGGRPITKAYYEDRLDKMDRRFLPDTLDLAGRRKFLEFIVNKELMAQQAEKQGYGSDPQVQTNMNLYTDNKVWSAAVDEKCKGKLDVSEAEIQDWVARRAKKVTAKQILVKSHREADDLYRQLQAGASFDALMVEHSLAKPPPEGQNVPSLLRPEVDVTLGETMIPIEEAVFGTPIGQFSSPVWTAMGWHLFLPVSVNETNRVALDAENRRKYETQIQLRKKRPIVEDYYEGILAAHGFRLDEEALDFLYDKLPQDLSPEQAPRSDTETKPVIAFTPEERGRFLFALDGKDSTIGAFSDQYDATSWFERPKRITGVIGIRYWIRDRWLKPLQLARARQDGIDKLPQVADDVALRREQMMVSILHNQLIDTQAPQPTEAQMQEFYDKYKSAYVDREKRRCSYIYNEQEKVVRRAWDEIQRGADFVDTAVRYNEGATKPEDVRTALFTRDDSRFGEVARLAFTLLNGQSSEPFRSANGWAVIHVDSIAPEQQLTLEQVHDNVVEDFKTEWSENKLNELLAQWRQETPVEIDDKVLAKAEVRRMDVYVPGRAQAEAGAKSESSGAP